MAGIEEFLEQYAETLQPRRPNMLEGLGNAIAGGAAPFLGQTWKNPYAQKQGTGTGGMQDMMSMMMMQKMMGGMGGGQGSPPPGGLPTVDDPNLQLGGPEEPYYTPLESSTAKKMFGEHPVSKMKRDIYKSGETSKQGFRKAETEKLSKKFGEAGRVVGAMMNLEGYGKAMDEVEIPNALKQLIQEKQNLVPYLNDETQNKINSVIEYVGQRVETTVGGLPIWSGQARYVKQLAMEISKTVPQAGLSVKNRQGLVGQSMRNILTLVYATANGQLSAAKLRNMGIDPDSDPVVDEKGAIPAALQDAISLTPKQEKMIEDAIDMMRKSPAIRGGKRDKGGKSKVQEIAPGFSSDEWELVQ